MKIIYNRFIPVRGYRAINLFGVLFARKGANIYEVTLRHEAIHTAQMKDFWYVGFYVLYIAFYVFFLLMYGNHTKAYRAIPFEKEAYFCQNNPFYLINRKPKWIWKFL